MLQTSKLDNRRNKESMAERLFGASVTVVVAVGTAPFLVAGAVARMCE